MSDDYHTGVDRLTSSGLKILLKKSPAHYYEEYTSTKTPPTKAMEFGIAAHALILEGEEAFAKVAVVRPDEIDGRTKEGKEFKKNANGKIVLTENEVNEIYSFRDIMKDSEYGSAIFSKRGKAEQVVEWRDAMTAADCKCKPDWMSKDGRLIIDLKMMADADPTNFKRSVYRYGYHISAAMYIEGVAQHYGTVPDFVWAVCEKGSGKIAFYTPSSELLSEGAVKVGTGMAIYAKCKDKNNWPAYDNGIVVIG